MEWISAGRQRAGCDATGGIRATGERSGGREAPVQVYSIAVQFGDDGGIDVGEPERRRREQDGDGSGARTRIDAGGERLAAARASGAEFADVCGERLGIGQ